MTSRGTRFLAARHTRRPRRSLIAPPTSAPYGRPGRSHEAADDAYPTSIRAPVAECRGVASFEESDLPSRLSRAGVKRSDVSCRVFRDLRTIWHEPTPVVCRTASNEFGEWFVEPLSQILWKIINPFSHNSAACPAGFWPYAVLFQSPDELEHPGLNVFQSEPPVLRPPNVFVPSSAIRNGEATHRNGERWPREPKNCRVKACSKERVWRRFSSCNQLSDIRSQRDYPASRCPLPGGVRPAR